jgi:hypothetical protein
MAFFTSEVTLSGSWRHPLYETFPRNGSDSYRHFECNVNPMALCLCNKEVLLKSSNGWEHFRRDKRVIDDLWSNAINRV